MNREEIAKEITAIVAEVTEVTEEEILRNAEANFFSELGVDSLLALEILALIEKKYRIQIPEERLSDITSLNQTIDLTIGLLTEDGKL